ncbi:unnamed protein product [Staurois parvus]|uniref:Uncharacterized protein n=1 Tax=Staurois parvus TaxID=386267 RepID=A0ABN9F7Z3_9NEOB|nr:unnamed protein product [Staurois parvus]
MLAVDGRGREGAQAVAGVSKVSIIGVSRRNSAPSLVSLWCQCGRNSAHHWCQCGSNSTPSLFSVGGLVPHCWCQWEE